MESYDFFLKTPSLSRLVEQAFLTRSCGPVSGDNRCQEISRETGVDSYGALQIALNFSHDPRDQSPDSVSA